MDNLNSILNSIYETINYNINVWYNENYNKSPQRILLDHMYILIPLINGIIIYYIFMKFFKVGDMDVSNTWCEGHDSIHLNKIIISELPIGYEKI
jgi:hypothetical protein